MSTRHSHFNDIDAVLSTAVNGPLPLFSACMWAALCWNIADTNYFVKKKYFTQRHEKLDGYSLS